MTEQEKFEAWYIKRYGCYPSKNNDARDHALFDCWQAAIASREPMPLEKAEEIAHRTAWDYEHTQGGRPNFYVFDKNTLEQSIRKVEKYHSIG